MNHRISFYYWMIVILCFCGEAKAGSVLIANASVKETRVSKEDITLIFLGKKTKWMDGQKIHVAVLKTGNTHEAFLDRYVNKTPAKYSTFWKIAIISGTGFPPKFFQKEADLVSYVAEIKGAIGYISAETDPGPNHVMEVQ